MKRCLLSLAIRKMQIKTWKSFQFTPRRTAQIKQESNFKCWPGYRELGLWWYSDPGSFLKLNLYLPYHPAIAFSPERWKLCPHKTRHTNVHGSFVWNSQEPETTKMSLNKWTVKPPSVHPHHGTEQDWERDRAELSTDTPWVDLKVMTMSKERQSHKVMYCMVPFTYHS